MNWQPAAKLYAEILSEHCGKEVEKSDLAQMFGSYPFGIAKLDAEMVVRDPYKVEDEKLITLDMVEQGSYVTVLYGNLESLLSGADKARSLACDNIEKQSSTNIFLVDCISRVLFMGDKYEEELKCLDPHKNSFGALTLGEIANNGDAYLEIYNKTAVVCALDV